MQQRARSVSDGVTKLVKHVVPKGAAILVQETRVDTGKARSNWQGSVGAPITSVRAPYAPGMRLGYGERANAAGALSQISTALSGFNAARDSRFFITNNVHYIGHINYGNAYMPPALFVERAVQTMVISARAVRILGK